jgi:hypothetical protein
MQCGEETVHRDIKAIGRPCLVHILANVLVKDQAMQIDHQVELGCGNGRGFCAGIAVLQAQAFAKGCENLVLEFMQDLSAVVAPLKFRIEK